MVNNGEWILRGKMNLDFLFNSAFINDKWNADDVDDSVCWRMSSHLFHDLFLNQKKEKKKEKEIQMLFE